MRTCALLVLLDANPLEDVSALRLIALALLIGIFFPIVFFIALTKNDWSISNVITLVLIAIGFRFFGGLRVILLKRGMSSSKTKYVLKKAEGVVAIHKEKRHSVGRSDYAGKEYFVYRMKVGITDFELDDDLVNVIKDNDVLAVYHLVFDGDASQVILSIEQIA